MSTEIPKTMRALVEDSDAKKSSLREISVPTLEENDVLVKTAYVSQNPTDWKHTVVPGIAVPNATIGCDFSGVVVKLGSGIKNSSLKVGDKVAGMVHGRNFEDKGSFAQYLRVQSDLVWAVPETGNVGLREAPVYGVGFVTAAQILYNHQGVALPPQKISGEKWYLVYGGSTSVGLFAVQLAKLAGFKVVATASPKNFDLVKSYGADEVVDYKDAEHASAEIKRITNNTLTLGLDTISEKDSFLISLRGFSDKSTDEKKKLNALLQVTEEAQKLAKEIGAETEMTLAYSLMGRGFTFLPGFDLPAIPQHKEFYQNLLKQVPDFVTKYGIKPNPITDRGSLDDVLSGFKEMMDGKVSATKLVYKIE